MSAEKPLGEVSVSNREVHQLTAAQQTACHCINVGCRESTGGEAGTLFVALLLVLLWVILSRPAGTLGVTKMSNGKEMSIGTVDCNRSLRLERELIKNVCLLNAFDVGSGVALGSVGS